MAIAAVLAALHFERALREDKVGRVGRGRAARSLLVGGQTVTPGGIAAEVVVDHVEHVIAVAGEDARASIVLRLGSIRSMVEMILQDLRRQRRHRR